MKIFFDPRRNSGKIDPRWFPIFKDKLEDHHLFLPDDGYNASEIDALIAFRLYENPVEAYPNLKCILSLAAGVNHFLRSDHFPDDIMLVRMIDQGIIQGMREYILSMILRHHIRHDYFNSAQEEGNWAWEEGAFSLAQNRRVGFLGSGELAKACALDAVHLGFHVMTWSRGPKHIEGVSSYHGDDALDEMLVESDILVGLLPLTDQTRGLMTADKLAKLPEGAAIINAGRGPVFVDEDLIKMLDNGHLSCAYLDVFSREPLPKDHPFWTHPKIHITPHISALTRPETAVEHIQDVLEHLEKGLAPPGLVDVNRGY